MKYSRLLAGRHCGVLNRFSGRNWKRMGDCSGDGLNNNRSKLLVGCCEVEMFSSVGDGEEISKKDSCGYGQQHGEELGSKWGQRQLVMLGCVSTRCWRCRHKRCP